MRFLSFLCLMLALGFSTPAAAAPALTDEGAATFKNVVESAISYQLKSAKISGQGIFAGNTAVTIKGDAYDAAINDVRLSSPDYGTLMIGTVLVRGKPQDDGSYRISMQLPATMQVTDTGGKPLAEISIASQRLEGVWHPSLQFFTSLDAVYQGIQSKSKDPARAFSFAVGKVVTSIKLAKNADDTWSGPMDLAIEKLLFNPADFDGEGITIEKMESNTLYDRANLAAAKKARDRFESLLDKPDTPAGGVENTMSFVDDMFKGTSGMMNGSKTTFSAHGIKVDLAETVTAQTPANKKPEKLKMSLRKTGGVFHARDLLQKKGAISMILSHEGLVIDDLSPLMAGVLPRDGRIEVQAENLPMDDIAAAFSSLAQSAVKSAALIEETAPDAKNPVDAANRLQLERQAQADMQAAMKTLPQALADSGARVVIRDTWFKSPELNQKIDGSFKPNPTSPFLTEGTLSISLENLDAYIAKLKKQSMEPGADPKVAGVAQMLIILQMSGQLQKLDGDKTARLYKIELMPDGRMLLNGADIAPLAGAMMGAGMGIPAQPAAPAPSPAPAAP